MVDKRTVQVVLLSSEEVQYREDVNYVDTCHFLRAAVESGYAYLKQFFELSHFLLESLRWRKPLLRMLHFSPCLEIPRRYEKMRIVKRQFLIILCIQFANLSTSVHVLQIAKSPLCKMLHLEIR